MIKQIVTNRQRHKVKAARFPLVLSYLLVSSFNCFAAGTPAGTQISSEGTLTYSNGSSDFTVVSDASTITIQELISANIESSNSNTSQLVSLGQPSAAISFKLTNTGNDVEGFVLSQRDTSGDDFDIATNFQGFYIDTNTGDGPFNSAVDTVYNNATPPILDADDSIVIWAVSTNFPTNLAADQEANVVIDALSQTFSSGPDAPYLGQVITNVAGSGIDAIYGTSISSTSGLWTFVIDNPSVNITIDKEVITVLDTGGGTKITAGSEITYQLTVNFEGVGGDATNVVITDPLPIELRLKDEAAGSITLLGSGTYTALPGDDIAEYDVSSNTVVITLPDTAVTSPATSQIIQFTTIIQ